MHDYSAELVSHQSDIKLLMYALFALFYLLHFILFYDYLLFIAVAIDHTVIITTVTTVMNVFCCTTDLSFSLESR